MEHKVWTWWERLDERERDMIIMAVYNMEMRELYEYLDDFNKALFREVLNNYYGEDMV
jgi:hypothetical protein